jgi:hypothetical protein
MKFFRRYNVGDYVIVKYEILQVKSFGYFWENVCELSNGMFCKTYELISLSEFNNLNEEKKEIIIRNIYFKHIIDLLVPFGR